MYHEQYYFNKTYMNPVRQLTVTVLLLLADAIHPCHFWQVTLLHSAVS